MNKRKIGTNKEKMAADYLRGLGYEIIRMNYFSRAGEIDIIARDGEYLVFVEVKYRASLRDGYPEESVDSGKMIKISRAALGYLNMCGYGDTVPCRFDVVSILGGEIKLIKNAFDFAGSL